MGNLGITSFGSLLTLAALSGPQAHALQTPWGPMDVTFSGEAEHDSNVLANGAEEKSAWIYRTTVQTRLTRAKGAIRMTAGAGLTWERFDGAGELSGVSPRADLAFTTGWEGYSASLGFNFSEGSEEDALRATRSRQRSYGANFSVGRRISGKWGAGLNANWSRTEDSEDSGNAGTTTWGLSPRVTYAWNDNLDFFAGYSMRRTESEAPGAQPTGVSGADAGVDGRLPIRLLPRVNLTATAGWQVRSGEGSSTRGGLLGDASIEYELSALTLIVLTAGQDFVTSLDADTGVSTRVGVRVQHRFAPRLTGNATVNWVRTSFDGGAADGEAQTAILGGVRLNYNLARRGMLYAGVSLTRSDSETQRRDFTRMVTTLGASIGF